MAINISVQYNGGFLPDMILLTLCNYHRGRTRLNAMNEEVLSLQSMTSPKPFDVFSPWLEDAQKV